MIVAALVAPQRVKLRAFVVPVWQLMHPPVHSCTTKALILTPRRSG
jgi:hypothetical protein